MLGFLLKLINPLNRILDTIDKRSDSETVKEQARQAALIEYAKAQARIINGPGRWLLLLFIAPLGFWFSAVCLYSVFWCRGCAFPQVWTIAALPAPLDQYAWVIISSLFAYGAALRMGR